MRPNWFASLVVFFFVFSSGFCGQDGRMKLCGREFIRMVVMSCGSSRMKRYTSDHDQEPPSKGGILEWLSRDQSGYLTSLTDSRKWKGLSQDPEVPKKLRDFMHATEHNELLQNAKKEARRTLVPPGPENVVSRNQRDVGPAGVCCRSGCKLSELVQYC